ncbi:MAG TPA: transporter [Candidatus Binatus sp.]|uniref:SphA family protein n=1 Tax=Candidatus Binatus sp. TaxID=2811406 RepID=UPI002B4959A6|nr:transporter [Candidatus Binatus sp.]HKN14186.1 transporter [Candidatus Binatus sp.]
MRDGVPAGGAMAPSRCTRARRSAAATRLLSVSGAAIVALVSAAGVVHASEYGVGTYRPGQVDLFAGMLPAPGGVLVKNYFLFQDASLTAQPNNAPVRAHTHTITYTDATFVIYTTPWRVFGANWGVATLAQTRIADQTLRVTVIGGPSSTQRSTVGGFGDLIVSPLMLNWNFSKFHLVSALMFYAPTGSYDRRYIIDIGLNRWAVEPNFGVTWLDPETGRHASLFAGYTVNAENPSTHYLSGQEFHADFVLAQHLPHGLVAGIAGYAVQQTTPDSGSGANLGAFKGRVIGLGPLVGDTVPILKVPISFSFKYDFEFAAQNRSTGNELWLTASFRF